MKYSFEEIKKKMNELVENVCEPELTLYMYGKAYMIIAYGDHCSFQRCGFNDGSGEVNYKTLDELYNTETVDNILLKRDWKDIENFECYDFDYIITQSNYEE